MLFRLEGISKSFSGIQALSGVSASFSGGETVLLLGANGSGKSTLLRVCAGLLRADGGTLKVGGGRIGHFGHSLFLYGRYSVEENLSLYAKLGGLQIDMNSYLESWCLERLRNRQVSGLSKGQQALVSLARSFLGDPDYLFLDEPSASLDEGANSLLLKKIEEIAARKGDSFFALIASHDVSRLSRVASRFIILREGSVMSDAAGSLGQYGEVSEKYLRALR